MVHGTKGFGFIQPDGGGQDVFVHISAVEKAGLSCWRRLRDWQQAGIWAALHRALLEHMEQTGQPDWRRASLDSTSVAAKKGGLKRVRTPRTAASRAPSATSSSAAVELRAA